MSQRCKHGNATEHCFDRECWFPNALAKAVIQKPEPVKTKPLDPKLAAPFLEPAPSTHCLLCKKAVVFDQRIKCPNCNQIFCGKCFTKPCVPWRDKNRKDDGGETTTR